MNYENKPCPGCGSHLHEGDDIVVCPECATPQHRACWMENGRCVNEHKHAEGFVWSADNTGKAPVAEAPELFKVPEPVKDPDAPVICPVCGSENPGDFSVCGRCGSSLAASENKDENENPSTDNRCKNCGAENDSDATFCKKCGAPMDIAQIPSLGPVFLRASDFDPEEKIGEHTSGELAVYTRKHALYYLKTFFKLESTKKKISFNWSAFFFGPFWFFYRKLYKWGVGLLLCFAALSLIFSSYFPQVEPDYLRTVEINEELRTNADKMTDDEYAKLLAEQNKINAHVVQTLKKPAACCFAGMVVLNLIAALFANYIYYKKILDDFQIISEEVTDDAMRAMFIRRRGGVSALNVLCCYFLYTLLCDALHFIAENSVRFFK